AFEMSAPVDAFLSGMGGDAALSVHDVKLPAFAPRVRRDQDFDDVVRHASLPQQPDAVDTVIGIHQRLRRNGADAGGDVRPPRTHRKKPRRDRYSELAGGIVFRNDRPGHLSSAYGSVALHAARIGRGAPAGTDFRSSREPALRPVGTDLDNMSAALELFDARARHTAFDHQHAGSRGARPERDREVLGMPRRRVDRLLKIQFG